MSLRLRLCRCWVLLLTRAIVGLLLGSLGANVRLRTLSLVVLGCRGARWLKLLEVFTRTVRNVNVRLMSISFLDQLDDLFGVVQLRVVASGLAHDDLLLFYGSMHRVPLGGSGVVRRGLTARLDVVNELNLIRREHLVTLTLLPRSGGLLGHNRLVLAIVISLMGTGAGISPLLLPLVALFNWRGCLARVRMLLRLANLLVHDSLSLTSRL